MKTPDIIYKICHRDEWESAERQGRYDGSADDLADGFIHFSTSGQLRETAEKHFSGQQDLVLVAVDVSQLTESLKWEPSRGGDLFPHLYAALPTSSVVQVSPLSLDEDGIPQLPSLET